MSDFEPKDWLTERLGALGAQPIDPAMQSRHLTAMAEAAAAPTLLGTFGARLRMAVAVGVGVLLGATGLATAGALGPLQPAASRAVEAATPLDVPDGKGKSAEAKARQEARGKAGAPGQQRVTEGCQEGISTRNRGQYLKGVREKFGADSPEYAAAKTSRCGMPLHSKGTPGAGDDGDAAEAGTPEANEPADDHGRPESPGRSDEAPGQDVKGTKGDGAGKPSDVPGEGKGLDQHDGPDTGKPSDAGKDGDPAGPPESVPVGPPSD